MKNKTVLIGGGTGLVGSRLTEVLMDQGYQVMHLSRSKASDKRIETIQWDVKKGELELDPKLKIDAVINLAGAGIADESWTAERKEVIERSRVGSNQLLAKALKSLEQKVEFFISASAIGYYGMVTSEKIFEEDDEPGNDFLAETSLKWEASAKEIEDQGIPTGIVRIGIVLSDEGGALVEIAKPVLWGVGAPLGSGKQYMPWIHIDDLCQTFIYVLEQKLTGTFNAVAPEHVNNTEFTKKLAHQLGRKVFLPNVPAFVMKLMLGSRAGLVLKGSRVSSEKLRNKGFRFEFPDLKSALADIYS